MEEIQRYLGVLRQLKDFDENLTREIAARAYQEQERMKFEVRVLNALAKKTRVEKLWRQKKSTFTAELWRAKRACGAPWVSKSTHPRKFGNHVTVLRPPARPSAPLGNQCLILTLSSQFGSTGRLILHTYIAHQCCDQLTAVKTGYPLTRITWPYRGLKCRPIEVDIFLKLSADK